MRARRKAHAAAAAAAGNPSPGALHPLSTPPPARARAPAQNVRMWFLMAGVVAAVILLVVIASCGVTFSRC